MFAILLLCFSPASFHFIPYAHEFGQKCYLNYRRSWATSRHVQAAADSLRLKICLITPKNLGSSYINEEFIAAANMEFVPVDIKSEEEANLLPHVKILWYKAGGLDLDDLDSWRPNHFIPILKVQSCPFERSVFCPNKIDHISGLTFHPIHQVAPLTESQKQQDFQNVSRDRGTSAYKEFRQNDSDNEDWEDMEVKIYFRSRRSRH